MPSRNVADTPLPPVLVPGPAPASPPAPASTPVPRTFSRREVPGPNSERLLRRQARVESNARSYPRRLPVAIVRAHGPYVFDADGHCYVDFLTGAGVLPLGHGHPELVEVIRRQAGEFVHGLDFPTPAKDAFVTAQLQMLPDSMRDRMRIHFCGPTGANTVDAAVKLAKTATGRGEVIAFRGGFHGTTHLSMSLTGLLEQRSPVSNTVPGIHFAPFSYCARCPLGLSRPTCDVNCAAWLETALDDPNGGLLPPAAVILELVQGEGGAIPAETEFVQRVAAATKAAGAVLIVDEVQTGCGRTGSWFAFEQYGIEPDIICASKALSGAGLPLGIIIYQEALDVWQPGAHTGTFRGNQLGFASGAATVEIMRRDRVLDNVRERGEQVGRLLGRLADLPHVREVRGRGLMWGIELQDPQTARPSTALARTVQSRALEHGLIVEVGGRDDSVVRILPPLNVTADLVHDACTLLVRLVRLVREAPGTGEPSPTTASSQTTASSDKELSAR